jgi:predicted PurR-regulated permease PerM
MDAAIVALGRWLQGVLLAMVSIGLVTGIGLWAMGIPLALALGVLGGALEFIPYIGPIVSAIPAVLIAFTVSPTRALEVLALYVAIHFIEGELLVPMIQRWAVALPPAVAIIAVVVFGSIFGLPGVIFATPLAVVLLRLVQTLYVPALKTD